MTNAPDSLKAARRLWLDTVPGLDPLAVGIVGDDNHQQNGSSYHLGKSALRPDSYTITESSRDRRGLSEDAAALDLGWFDVTVNGRRHTLRTYSVWLVAQCKAGTADTGDIREVIYSPDGKTVKRWDRLGRRSTGDDSHLSHTHHSYFRDSTKRDKTALFRRYFTEIGLLEDDMPTADEIADAVWNHTEVDPYDTKHIVRTGTWLRYVAGRPMLEDVGKQITALSGQVTALGKSLSAAISALAGQDHVDEQALAAALAPGVAAVVVAALPEDRDDITPAELQEAIVGALRELASPPATA